MPQNQPSPEMRHGVFLSSTDDPVMRAYRYAAREVIQGEEFSGSWHAVDMSGFAANSLPPKEVCRDKVLSCLVYVGILGPIYGSICQPDGVSYTDYEYRVARDAGRIIGIFSLPLKLLEQEPYEVLRRQCELLPRQEAFRDAVGGHTTKPVKDLDEFKRELARFLRDVTRELARPEVSGQQGTALLPLGGSESDTFDRRPVQGYGAEDLDPELVASFLQRSMTQQELSVRGLGHAPGDRQLRGLGLMTEAGMALGTFLCFAPGNLTDKTESAACLYMVVYDGIERASSKTIFRRESCDNLTRLFDQGLECFRTHLRWVGEPGQPDRDALEIPEIALREAIGRFRTGAAKG